MQRQELIPFRIAAAEVGQWGGELCVGPLVAGEGEGKGPPMDRRDEGGLFCSPQLPFLCRRYNIFFQFTLHLGRCFTRAPAAVTTLPTTITFTRQLVAGPSRLSRVQSHGQKFDTWPHDREDF
jgi:hypothetical protein